MANTTGKPVIELQLTPQDKQTERMATTYLIVLWVIVAAAWLFMAKTIPMHFNAKNEVDEWGNKANLFMKPFVATMMYWLITIINKYPQHFNYTKTVTEQNALKLYTRATGLVRTIKMAIMIAFVIDTINDLLIAHTPSFHGTIPSTILQWTAVAFVVSTVVVKLLNTYGKD